MTRTANSSNHEVALRAREAVMSSDRPSREWLRPGRGLFRIPSGRNRERSSRSSHSAAGDDDGAKQPTIVTLRGLKRQDGIGLSAIGLPAVRMSTIGNVVLPSTFHFEPIEENSTVSFDQAAGHKGSFKLKGHLLVKAVDDREVQFYQKAAAGEWPVQFLPEYAGVSEDGTGIQIQNLLHNLARPCVMDLKMGFQSVEADETSRLKRIKHAALDKFTGSKHSGVRLEGMSLYRTLEKRRMKGTKTQSHSVSANMGVSLQDVLTFFLTDESGVRTDIALRFQAHIEALLHYFKLFNDKYLFIGSSILLIYDNDNSLPHMRWTRALQRLHHLTGGTPISPDLLTGLTRRTAVDVRMIDFAHVGPLPSGQERDFGYIQGLQTILEALKAIRVHHTRPIFSMAAAAADAQDDAAKVTRAESVGDGGSSPSVSDGTGSAFNFAALYDECDPCDSNADSFSEFRSQSSNGGNGRPSNDFTVGSSSRSSRESAERPSNEFARTASCRSSKDVSGRASKDG